MELKKVYNITNIPCDHIKILTNMILENNIDTGVVEKKGEDIFLSFDVLEIIENYGGKTNGK